LGAVTIRFDQTKIPDSLKGKPPLSIVASTDQGSSEANTLYFIPKVWGFDKDAFQLRCMRTDTNKWAADNELKLNWMAVWNS
jgi:hypothetical protein